MHAHLSINMLAKWNASWNIFFNSKSGLKKNAFLLQIINSVIIRAIITDLYNHFEKVK